MTQAQISNPLKFIKVIDPILSMFLVESGFSYTKDGKFFAFYETPELLSVLKRNFSDAQYFADNKLRF